MHKITIRYSKYLRFMCWDILPNLTHFRPGPKHMWEAKLISNAGRWTWTTHNSHFKPIIKLYYANWPRIESNLHCSGQRLWSFETSSGSRIRWKQMVKIFYRQVTINIWNENGHVCTSGEGPNAADEAENKDWRIRKRRSLPKKRNKNFALLKSIVNHSATIRPKRRSRVLEMARRIHLSREKQNSFPRKK